jgi:hypothetical protein
VSSSGHAAVVPSEAAAVARRYRRVERPVSGAVALLVGGACGLALWLLPLVQASLVAAGVVALVRVPVLRSEGRAELTTDADPGVVRAAFESATPPLLAFQWGLADEVRSTAEGGACEVTYLFGLRSVTMETAVRCDAGDGDDGDGDAPAAGPTGDDEGSDVNCRLVVTAGGEPWATYSASIARRDDGTVVTVEWTSDRRFGLRRLPQWLVATRYRDEALAAQGFAVRERDARLAVGGPGLADA